MSCPCTVRTRLCYCEWHVEYILGLQKPMTIYKTPMLWEKDQLLPTEPVNAAAVRYVQGRTMGIAKRDECTVKLPKRAV